MSMFDSLFSSSSVLNEQIARQIFEVLPDSGPIMIIVDRSGSCWPSDSAEFAKLNLSEAFIQDICSKIDDGSEPVLTQTDECSIIATQLATERTNCGYVLVALPHYSPESTLINVDLIEIVLNQVCLIAKLIEKNGLLYEFQIKQTSLAERAQRSEN